MEDPNLLTKRPVGSISHADAKMNAAALNSLLANEFTLFTKTLNYHWNVTGPRFHSLHNFLEEQYHELLEVMDRIAERVRVLDEVPINTVEKMNSCKEIKENNGSSLTSSQMMEDLLQTNLYIQESIKNTVSSNKHLGKDPGTEDFLVGLLQKHEMISWKMKSHLVY